MYEQILYNLDNISYLMHVEER